MFVVLNLILVMHNNNNNNYAIAWRRPTLAETKSQLPSALESLTTVFGMGTGVTFPPSLPDNF